MNFRRMKKAGACLVSLLMVLCLSACSVNIPGKKVHSECALSLKKYLEEDPELMALMEKSIEKAHETTLMYR